MTAEQILAITKNYVKRTLEGEGAVKGVPCEIETITDNEESIDVIFRWEDKDGNVHHQDMSIHKPIDTSSIYDFDEQIVGSWVNGEPIYRRVIQLDDPSLFQKGVAFKVTNFEANTMRLVKGYGLIKTYEGSYSNSDILVYSNNTAIMAKQNFTGYPHKMWIIIEYIKEE